jgi:hypothetical protein
MFEVIREIVNMKAKDLIALLSKYPDAEIEILYEYDCENVNCKMAGVIYENDGLRPPKVYLATGCSYNKYDEDFEHGFKIQEE